MAAEPKTKVTRAGVKTLLKSVDHAKRREDSLKPLEIMTEITGEKPKMWGPTMVGFGTYHYKYARFDQSIKELHVEEVPLT